MTGRMWLFFFLLLVAKPALGENEHFKDRMNINAETQKTSFGEEFVPTKETVYGNIAVKSAEIYPKVIPPIKGPDDLKIVLELAESIPKAVKYLEADKSLMTITKTNVDTVTHNHKENAPVPVQGKGHVTETVTDSSVDRFTPDHKGDVVNRTPGYKGTTPSSDSGHTNSLVTTTQTIPGLKKRPEKTFVTGPCSATCGIGLQDIYRIKGCTYNKSRCRVRVQECIVTPDCGWGKPVFPSKAKQTEEGETDNLDDIVQKYVIYICIGLLCLVVVACVIQDKYQNKCDKKNKNIESKGEVAEEDERITISINGSDKKDPASDPGQHQTLDPETIEIEVRASSPVIVH